MFLQKDIDRFWGRVDKDGPIPEHMLHLGKCWIYKIKGEAKAYGSFYTSDHIECRAHRFSYCLYKSIDINTLKPSNYVCHHCDNPSCVNPEHLFLGTQSDNMKDASRKGRLPDYNGKNHPLYGWKRPKDKCGFTGKHHTQESKDKIGKKHKGKIISKEQRLLISIKKKGVRPNRIYEKGDKNPIFGEKHPFYKITNEQKREIYKKYHVAKLEKRKLTQEQLAQEYGVDQTLVSNIIRNPYYGT